ncbi:P2X purinoceptor 7 isoform X1 [Hyla sarda]|uniref:P2X purinoceptor 7 isoform X1 n=2 Tax=Hyla sarda TaxID=327740 RepID=UPI0024C27F41|nr:P2X purinoceptor 7 isoform X1 [Hyla sarda]XP_056390512.1 P2X purinoceptor 7 isoform X1 [Hyla sarda]XP_056390520.1 P2X purinoceptor 7 isoform X1 [Hyla sarda]
MSFCEYSTDKELRIRSVPLGTLKWVISAGVFLYMCTILFTEKRYQRKETVISSVHTKVKGVLEANSSIWDPAEYTVPSPDGSSFFVVTNVIKTENQKEGICPEFPHRKTICSQNMCKKGHADTYSNGIQTGLCVEFNKTYKTCEVRAWCPVESRSTPEPAILASAENFTVLIKNTIHFATFGFTRKNILPEYNVTCKYNKVTAPRCPIFRLGDILSEAGETFSQVAILGGIMGIEIHWNCDLDPWAFSCHPQYNFRRLDDKAVDESLFPGLSFRFAKHYKAPDQTDRRTLIKAYGIRFDIQVYGTGGQFRFLELVIFIGSYLSYFGLATVVIDLIVSQYYTCCCSPKSGQKYYDEQKYKEIQGPSILTSCLDLKFISYVDQNYIIMVDKRLKKSLQETNGHHIQRKKFTSSKFFRWMEDPAGIELLPPTSKDFTKDSAVPEWCRCLKCHKEKGFEDQLCCRSKKGECITNSDMFKKLVLDRNTLAYILQYNDPLLNIHSLDSKKLVDCAEEQYIQWRFGSNKDIMCFSKVPSCCKFKIRNVFNSEIEETALDEKTQSSSDASRKALLQHHHK